MKPNIMAEFVNELRKTAIKYKDYHCLRECLSKVVKEYVPIDKTCKGCFFKTHKSTVCKICSRNKELEELEDFYEDYK